MVLLSLRVGTQLEYFEIIDTQFPTFRYGDFIKKSQNIFIMVSCVNMGTKYEIIS